MKPIPERYYYLSFRIGVILKGLVSIGEIIVGAALYLFTTETINRIIFSPFGDEVLEWPLNQFHGITAASQPFWAFTLLSHGIVKGFFTIGLWKEKLWAYPSAAAIFALFVIYQVRQMYYTPSIFLTALNIFDVILIGLILHEYRRARKRNHLKAGD